jgi:SWI/SNF-related matrix-associated actin-dependent regulator of chromatin subfamily A containing DEAD/H box 1
MVTQAEDRAHRVGQTKNVTVVRLVTNSTIEEHIYKSARLKLELDASVSKDTFTSKTNDNAEVEISTSVLQVLKDEMKNAQ